MRTFLLILISLGFFNTTIADDDLIWDGSVEEQSEHLFFLPFNGTQSAYQIPSRTPKRNSYQEIVNDGSQSSKNAVRMVKIFGGCFENKEASDLSVILDEQCVDDFYISDAEVSNAQYNEFLLATGKSVTIKSNLSHPVANISWQDAIRFANWLSKTHGKQYLLPSVAQWQYAARKGDQKNICKWANVKGCVYQSSLSIRSLNANQWGLFDMVGNVSEWLLEKDMKIGGSWNTKLNSKPYVATTGSADTGFRLVSAD